MIVEICSESLILAPFSWGSVFCHAKKQRARMSVSCGVGGLIIYRGLLICRLKYGLLNRKDILIDKLCLYLWFCFGWCVFTHQEQAVCFPLAEHWKNPVITVAFVCKEQAESIHTQ